MLSWISIAAATLIVGAPVTNAASIPLAPTHFTLLVMDHFGDKSQQIIGAIRRTTGPNHQDVIAVKKTEMSPELVVYLARSLQNSVTARGASPLKQISIYITKRRSHLKLSQEERTWANTLIAQSALSAVQDFGKLGKHPAIASSFDVR